MRLLALSLAFVSFAALAGEPAAPVDQGGKPPAPESTAASAPGEAASAPEHKRVCQRESAIGSSIAHTVCHDELTQGENTQALDGLRNNINRVLPTKH